MARSSRSASRSSRSSARSSTAASQSDWLESTLPISARAGRPRGRREPGGRPARPTKLVHRRDSRRRACGPRSGGPLIGVAAGAATQLDPARRPSGGGSARKAGPPRCRDSPPASSASRSSEASLSPVSALRDGRGGHARGRRRQHDLSVPHHPRAPPGSARRALAARGSGSTSSRPFSSCRCSPCSCSRAPSSAPLVLAATASLLASLLIAQRSRESTAVELAAEQINARRDQLTGAPNRRAFEEAMIAEHCPCRPRRPCRRGSSSIDLDRFKSVNDRFGHGVGDEVLIEVVRRLTDGLRPADLVARWGGEEITVLAPGRPRPASARAVRASGFACSSASSRSRPRRRRCR